MYSTILQSYNGREDDACGSDSDDGGNLCRMGVLARSPTVFVPFLLVAVRNVSRKMHSKCLVSIPCGGMFKTTE